MACSLVTVAVRRAAALRARTCNQSSNLLTDERYSFSAAGAETAGESIPVHVCMLLMRAEQQGCFHADAPSCSPH